MALPLEILVQKYWRPLMVAIFLLAAALRIYGLVGISPPGLEHDEVAHWLINQGILNGDHQIYFSEAYGHEAGYHYFQTLFGVLLGDNILALRLPSVFAGVLLIAAAFAIGRKLFDIRTGLLSAALLAVLFWPVFYSRLGLRAISLPLISGLSIIFFWQGWTLPNVPAADQRNRLGLNRPNSFFILAGIMAGASLYTYMASRVAPIFYLLFILYLFLFHRGDFRSRQPGIFRFVLIFLIIALPLTIYLLSTPGAESRISEVNRPLVALLEGSFAPVLENVPKVLAMFGLQGDPLWRQNVAHLPVFEPVIALFFYIGLAISLWRWREPRYTLLTLWLFTAVIPSIVTIDAPSSIRMINALPVVAIFPVIGLEVIHFLRSLSTVSSKLSPNFSRIAALIGLLVVCGLYIVRTTRATFQIWPDEEEVRFVWQEALTEAANYLDELNQSSPVSVGGWSPDTMDPATIELTLIREDLELRFFDPQSALIIPAAEGDQTVRIIRPSMLPMNPYLEGLLVDVGADIQDQGSFTTYEMGPDQVNVPEWAAQARFGEQLDFLGYEWRDSCSPKSSCEMVTYWRVLAPTDESWRLFLHLIDQGGSIIVQDDKLEIPAVHWQPDDLLIQILSIERPPLSEAAELRLGVYDPSSGSRLKTQDGEDYLLLESWFGERVED